MSKLARSKPATFEELICDSDINADRAFWDRVYELPHYYIVNNTFDFLRLTAYAMLKPLGTIRDDRGWHVLFKYCTEIKYIDKYIEEYQFSDEEWDDFRRSLSSQNRTYYELLEKWDETKARKSREIGQ